MEPYGFTVVAAPAALRPFVRRFLVAKDDRVVNQRIHPVPSGYSYICWIHSGELRAVFGDTPLTSFDGLVFFGQLQNHFAEVTPRDQPKFLLAEFTPTGQYRLAHVNGRQLYGRAQNVADVSAPFAERLLSRTHKALGGGLHWPSAFQHALLSSVDEARPDVDYVAAAAAAIEHSNGLTQVSDICRDLNVSERQLRRRFTEIVGVTPKYFAKMLQLNTAMEALFNDDRAHLTKLAHGAGYYDQPHFVRVMQQFHGQGPREFLDSDHVYLADFFRDTRRYGKPD